MTNFNIVGAYSVRPFSFLAFVFLLAGCISHPAQFSTPEKIVFQNQIFERITHNQLDEMQQMLYLPKDSGQTPENWQQGVLLFLDKNTQARSLSARAKLRQQRFADQVNTQATVAINQQELQSQVIYPPTERWQNVQLEVTRGRDLDCGYGQMQFADKRSISDKNLQNLAEFQPLLMQLAAQFAQLAWQIGCR
ncbi:ABC transporter ATPase [Bibersteinia trehalosi]|uniref:ABC transporter ATPase n=1 Tax=Bibersteinia trehalosi TaxID=47735 RepID=UPI002D794326|nr:ABC transporter ATPase [Bibersteinia trehalosi]